VYFPDAGRIRRIAAATGVISTLAGSNGVAVEGFGIAPDGAAGWLVADFAGHRVNRIDALGAITIVAGTGQPGFNGDGLSATARRLNGPTAVAVHAGNIYIADTFNHRVRMVDSTGTITTVAGNGTTGLPGATFSSHVDGVLATSARVWNPTGLAFRNGNMYIAEQFGHRVRMVNTLGIISTFAGGGTGGDGGPASNAQLGRPTNLTFDTLGNLYITETELSASRVRRVDASGTIETIAGTGAEGFSGDGGPATLATFAQSSPWGVAVDSQGNMFLGDRFNNRIRRLTPVNNTPAGSNVTVSPIDGLTASAPVTLTFSSVTQSGVTSLTMSSGGPPPPAGFQLGTPPVYYELTTTAVFAGSITVCIDYTGITFAGPPALYHLENGLMVDRTVFVDALNEIVCGSVTSLSPFALFQDGATPAITDVRPDVRELWPANHRMVAVTISVDTIDNSGVAPSCRITEVTSNEPDNDQGDGGMLPDWLITADLTVELRAERSGRGSGRVYTIGIRCVDGAGNAAAASTSVRVPHDRRR
jgi:hypothetical protein